MRTAGRILLRTGLALVAAVAILCALLAWRLGQGPIPLAFLDSRIEKALAGAAPDLTADVEQTELVWSHRGLEIRVLGLKLSRWDGTSAASIPELSVRPRLRALLLGRFAVGGIGVSGMRLSLSRNAEGRLMLGKELGAGGVEGEAQRDLLLSALGVGSGGGDFSRLDLRGARLELDDRVSETTWLVNDADLAVRLTSGGIVARLRGALELKSGTFVTLRELALGLSANADVSLAADGSIARLAFDARGENGRIAPAADTGPAVPLRSLTLAGIYSGESRTLEVPGLRAVIGSAEVEASGSLSSAGDRLALDARGELRSLPVEELQRLWPAGYAEATRAWVAANIEGGRVPRCRFVLRLPPAEAASATAPAVDPVDVRFDLEDVGVHYLRPLDPLRAVRGWGRLTSRRFEAAVESAESGNLRISQGRMEVNLRVTPAEATIAAEVRGPTGELLALIDEPPLGIPSGLGIPSTGAGGTSEVHTEIRFAFIPELATSDVHVTAAAELSDTTLPGLFGDVGIEKGRLRVRVDDRRFEVEGETGVTGVAAVRSPVQVAISFAPGDGGVGQLRVKLEGQDVHAEGVGQLDGRTLSTFSLKQLRLGRNDLAAELAREPAGDYRVSLQGASLDLEPLRERLRSERQAPSRIQGAWKLDLNVARGLTAGDLELADLRGDAAGQGESLRTLKATANIAGGGAARVELTAPETGRRLDLSSDQAGKVLKWLGLYGGAEGGRLSLGATIDESSPQHRFQGQLDVSDFRILKAPRLARVLSLGSLDGIAKMLEDGGIAFTRARLPFTWTEDRIELLDGRAVGAIGLTADGFVDRRGGSIDLAGNIIPAYTLNSALGKVPFVGELLVGGEGEGIFGIRYRVKGTLEEPEIAVNPLSVLAPGALRRMFFDPFKPGGKTGSDNFPENER